MTIFSAIVIGLLTWAYAVSAAFRVVAHVVLFSVSVIGIIILAKIGFLGTLAEALISIPVNIFMAFFYLLCHLVGASC